MINWLRPIRAARFLAGCPFAFLRRHAVLLLAFALPVAAVAADAPVLQADVPEGASGFAPVRSAVAEHVMVVTAHPEATAAATAILRRGGTALDAAIAAQLVLGVVEPQSSGLGGGGFLLLRDGRDGRLRAYDGRETAPRRASDAFARDASGRLLPFSRLVGDGRSVGVPGLLPMLALAHRRHGRLPWATLFEQAIGLAAEGFSVSPRLHRMLTEDPLLRNDPAAAQLFYPGGGALAAGQRLRNPALAEVLRTVARDGADALQSGPLAEAIVGAAAARSGVLEIGDLDGYRAVEREPLCAYVLRYRVCGMPPPSSGGIAVLQVLSLASRAKDRLRAGTPADHLLAEAGRLAFADRARYVGDPDYVAVPTAALVASDYLERRAGLIDSEHAMTGPAQPGVPMPSLVREDGTDDGLPATTHLSVVDAEGGAVALTSSIEAAFGSRIAVRGFLLNNQLTDFALADGSTGRPVANALGPGKRPVSAMSPTLVLDDAGQVVAVLGSAGGPRIISQTARAAWMLLAEGRQPADVVAAPHLANRNGVTEVERGRYPAAARAGLEQRGHVVREEVMTSGLHLILRRDGRWHGAADPRREGEAAGY